jgi:hypothetical protein
MFPSFSTDSLLVLFVTVHYLYNKVHKKDKPMGFSIQQAHPSYVAL